VYRACLDTSETGDLASCKLMGEFSEDPINNFDYITASDRMIYSFNVYNDGDVLEIVSLGCKYKPKDKYLIKELVQYIK